MCRAEMAGIPRTLSVAACAAWLACWAPEAAAKSLPVLQAQQRLEALGLDPGPIDGLMGTRTRGALRAFQQKNDLPVTGELDVPTRLALAASVRSIPDAVPFPAPRAAPVPAVSISDLAAPGTEPTPPETGRPADSDTGADASTIEGGDLVGTETVSAGPRTGFERLLVRADAFTASPAAVEADDTRMTARLIPAVALGVAAAGMWIGLLVWWLRQRSGRASPDVVDD